MKIDRKKIESIIESIASQGGCEDASCVACTLAIEMGESKHLERIVNHAARNFTSKRELAACAIITGIEIGILYQQSIGMEASFNAEKDSGD